LRIKSGLKVSKLVLLTIPAGEERERERERERRWGS